MQRQRLRLRLIMMRGGVGGCRGGRRWHDGRPFIIVKNRPVVKNTKQSSLSNYAIFESFNSSWRDTTNMIQIPKRIVIV